MCFIIKFQISYLIAKRKPMDNQQTTEQQVNKYKIFRYEDRNYSVVYLYDDIDEPKYIPEIIELLETASDTETIYFKICSYGGYLDTASALNEAMKNSLAYIVVQLSGSVMSAATIISLQADELHVTDDVTFMIHAMTYGSYGKTHEVISHTQFSYEAHVRLLKSVYKKFLTKKELKNVLNGADMYLNADQVRERWDKVVAYRVKQNKKQQIKMLKEQYEQVKAALQQIKEEIQTIEDSLEG